MRKEFQWQKERLQAGKWLVTAKPTLEARGVSGGQLLVLALAYLFFLLQKIGMMKKPCKEEQQCKNEDESEDHYT